MKVALGWQFCDGLGYCRRRRSRLMMNSEIPPEHPVKAYKNLPFLNSPEARSIRVLCEMEEPKARFQKEGIENTIVFFGSARTEDPETQEVPTKQARFYGDARELARRLTKWSLGNHHGRHAYAICSGGGPGIMEAANRGARDAGGKSVALGISLPLEQGVNQYATPDLAFEFHYFFVRKYWFAYMAKSMVIFPGGFGTLDELFEMITLMQTEKIRKRVPIVLYGKEFWDEVVNFDKLVEWGTISPEDVDNFCVIDTVEEAEKYLIEEMEKGLPAL